jgi:acetyltransferase-like isoleucine patch superfamily enzyme
MINPTLTDIIEKIDLQRRRMGFLTISQLLALDDENVVLDPFSTLISESVAIGAGNVFYPNVTIEARQGGTISIGSHNLFHSATSLLADRGVIVVGSFNELGDGGLRIKANEAQSVITLGDHGRYMSGALITGRCTLESGSQVLGNITVQNCTLEAGDSYKDDDPDKRAGVLKGFGVARNLLVRQGEVINGRGSFEQSQIERQVVYHPKPMR